MSDVTASEPIPSAVGGSAEIVRFYPSRGHAATLVVVALALAVVCGAADVVGFNAAQTDGSSLSLIVAGAGAVGALMALGAAFIALRRMLVARWPVLIVDDDGFTDWLPNLGTERVEWDEVTGIRDVSVAGRAVIAVDVTDPRAVISRQRGPLRRIAATTNTRVAGTPVILKPGSIDASADQIRSALTPHLARPGRPPVD